MVFVMLGTLNHPFNRFLNKIEELKNKNIIKGDVFVQAGETQFVSKNLKVVDYLTPEEFSNVIQDSELIITHGGLGSIIAGLKKNKKVIAVPRKAKFKEHVDDHQIEIVEYFTLQKHILMSDVDDLEDVILKSDVFEPLPYRFNESLNEFMFNLEAEINKLLENQEKVH
ncbi:MAG: hypothetical protein KKF00_08350 [Proteobacteria bacterium]|nr:hypothetical protein [Pseudomonadota bacterium]